MRPETTIAQPLLGDGIVFESGTFGFPKSIAGEVVFNSSMMGYHEYLKSK